MSKHPLEYLRHIHEECMFLQHATKNLSFDDFWADDVLKRAVTRSLEIIGEASKKIPVDVKLRWNLVQWKNMAGMRDRLIHEYFGVNYTIVWDVVKNKIPPLTEQIQEILERDS